MKFRITQFVEAYHTFEFEAEDEAAALDTIRQLNEGLIGTDDAEAELVDENTVDGGEFTLNTWRE